TRILMLVNFRPEYHAAWMQKSYYQQLPLLPLGPEAISELLEDLLGNDSSLAGLGDRIRKRTGGNPFFIEEIVQALAESGSLVGTRGSYRLVRPAGELTLPGTVQAVLAARIDRLAEREKHLLQTAAVIGKEFSEPVLRRVGELPESDLATAIGKLICAEFIYERALYPELEYTFKHALTQEVAYNSLLVERRQTLHERTAEAIQGLFCERLEERLSELAHHYSHSRNTQKAIQYSQLAGERAVKGSANTEAINHLTTALRLLESRPDTRERAQQELTLQVALGAPLIATKGWAAPELEKAYALARDLCRQVGEARELFPVLFGMFSFYLVRAEHRTARELAEQLLRLAENVRDPGLLVEAHFALGSTSFWLGEPCIAREQFDQALALYDSERHRAHAYVYARVLALRRPSGRDGDFGSSTHSSDWRSAQVVGIVGEPGVGNSRLCFEFLERCRARGLPIFEAHGVPHGKALPLLPMLELFWNFFGITEQDSDQVAREKIAGRFLLLDESLREVLPLVFDLLGVSDPERPVPAMDPQS